MQVVTTQSKVYVDTQETTYESYHSGERYGDWSESKDFDVTDVKLTQDFYEECFDLGEPVFVGETVHVVYIVYETGDSFGRSTGNGELVWVFKDKDLATAAVSKIEKCCKDYSIEIDLGNNRKMTWSNPAAGYFERLNYAECKSFVLKP